MTARPATSSSRDPILAATTVEEFVAAIDEVYGLDLPTAFPGGTTLAALWDLPVTVVGRAEHRRRYVATAREHFQFGRPLAGTVVVALDVAGDPFGPDPLSAR